MVAGRELFPTAFPPFRHYGRARYTHHGVSAGRRRRHGRPRRVANGQEALASILARRPDLIILDLFMPEMDGPSLLEITRSYLRLQSLPVIVLTGAPDSPQVERVRHLKVNAILTKAKATHDEILHEVAQQLPRLPG